MNERGTAPGMWFTPQPPKGSKDSDKKVFVSLPGVPHEMKGLMKKEVLPRLQQHFKMPFILHQTFLTYGIGESFLAEKIKDWEENLPSHFKTRLFTPLWKCSLRITATGEDQSKLEKELEERSESLRTPDT
jgi:nicotinamide-nucleotide amidase